ncbi:MAG: MGMT family protein [Oscillospiraceae bacterium]|nr:MGMT family protein [Oscillospiraceae bacterium]
MEEKTGKSSVFERIYQQVERIPKGKVASYGLIAGAAGNPRWARVVGYALHVNPRPGEIPCHRVVKKDGSVAPGFAFGGPNVQRDLLEAEGVTFLPDGRVDLAACGCSLRDLLQI